MRSSIFHAVISMVAERLVVLLAAASIPLLLVADAPGQTVFWTGKDAGWFDAGTPESPNWTNFQGMPRNPPNSNTSAVIDAGTSHIDMPGASVRSLTVGMEGSGSVVIDAGMLESTALARIGYREGSQGTVVVSGGSAWTVDDQLIVGLENSSRGEMTISGGGFVSTNLFVRIAQNVGSNGTVMVRGGSTLTIDDHLEVGREGDGELIIEAGGNVTNADRGWISAGPGLDPDPEAKGTVTVSGSGSNWTNGGGLTLWSDATLTISDGGTVTSNEAAIGNERFDSMVESIVVVTDEGSSLAVDGELNLGNGSGAGVLLIASGANVSSGDANVGNSNNNSDTQSAGTATITGSGSRWDSDGEIVISSGRHTEGTLTVSNGGVVSANDRVVVGTNGELLGDGTIEADVLNRATIAPVGTPGGRLAITGDFVQEDIGTLQIGAAGTTPGITYDQLAVGGEVDLDGAVEFSLEAGFMPAVGDQFDVITGATSVSGQFSNAILPGLPKGMIWLEENQATGFSLRVGTAFTADFDVDGDVAGDDLAQWQGDFGLNGMSDADGDGESDGADFLAWQRQFGSGVATTAAVPEPASLVLLVLSGLTATMRPTERSLRKLSDFTV